MYKEINMSENMLSEKELKSKPLVPEEDIKRQLKDIVIHHSLLENIILDLILKDKMDENLRSEFSKFSSKLIYLHNCLLEIL
jgi:hypothetical protein